MTENHPLPSAVDAPPLTHAQRELLHIAANPSRLDPPDIETRDGVTYLHVAAFGYQETLCRTLVDLGLLAEHPTYLAFGITDAGRAAIAPQPGDALPETPDAPGIDVPDGAAFPLPEFVRNDVLHHLAERNGELLTTIQDERETNHRLKTTIDALRRDLAAANARLAQQPDDLATLRAQVNELVSIVLEPVPYALVERKSTKVEVRTLRKSVRSAEKAAIADRDLADALNDGWQVIDIAIESGASGMDSWCNRIVTLTREIDDDAAGPDPQAEAAAPDAAPQPEPADAYAPMTHPVTIDLDPPRPSLNELPVLAQRIRTDGLDATKATLNADLFAIGQAAYEARMDGLVLPQRPPQLPGLDLRFGTKSPSASNQLPVIGGVL